MNEDAWLKILACPICDDRPELLRNGNLLICSRCGRGFRIESGIPQMLPEDALPPEKVRELTHES